VLTPLCLIHSREGLLFQQNLEAGMPINTD
jgi:hypothetical protein